MTDSKAWAVVLAGGDGSRLKALTQFIAGEDRPKQFCKLYGNGTLLAQTRSRLAPAISPEQTVFSVVKAHEKFYAPELTGVTPTRIVVQPSNKGTTAAIISSLLRITHLAGDPIVGFFPTDHHYSQESRFVGSVREALRVAMERPHTVVLLGAAAEHPEVEYGWIEPGASLECPFTASLLSVNRFWEKPSKHIVRSLLTRGCLWNTFVMIGRASAYLELLRASVPRILRAFETESSRKNADGPYAAISPGDFSRQVLSALTERLAVLRLGDVGWSDLGTPERAMSAMARSGLKPSWQETARHEPAAAFARRGL